MCQFGSVAEPFTFEIKEFSVWIVDLRRPTLPWLQSDRRDTTTTECMGARAAVRVRETAIIRQEITSNSSRDCKLLSRWRMRATVWLDPSTDRKPPLVPLLCPMASPDCLMIETFLANFISHYLFTNVKVCYSFKILALSVLSSASFWSTVWNKVTSSVKLTNTHRLSVQD